MCHLSRVAMPVIGSKASAINLPYVQEGNLVSETLNICPRLFTRSSDRGKIWIHSYWTPNLYSLPPSGNQGREAPLLAFEGRMGIFQEKEKIRGGEVAPGKGEHGTSRAGRCESVICAGFCRDHTRQLVGTWCNTFCHLQASELFLLSRITSA